jgi:hypothetical protein
MLIWSHILQIRTCVFAHFCRGASALLDLEDGPHAILYCLRRLCSYTLECIHDSRKTGDTQRANISSTLAANAIRTISAWLRPKAVEFLALTDVIRRMLRVAVIAANREKKHKCMLAGLDTQIR